MKDELLATLRPYGQEHLLASWDQLDDERRGLLARQIRAIDWALIERLYRGRNDQADFRQLAERAGPPPAFRLDAAENRFAAEQARQRGQKALAAGHLGVVIVAGGQGTRLGFEHPKGMFPIGPVSGRTLFQIHAEKIVAASRRYGVRIPLLLMTSPATHDETVAFFARHARFGLPEEDVRVFCQGTMPAVDAASGRALLERPDRLALSPDGHGGMLSALERSSTLAELQRRGVRQLFYLQVDNPLVDICSAEFIGYHLLSGSEMSSQVVAKREPLDRVGNVVEVDGRLVVIEYSDLPDEIAARRTPGGSLEIWAGSIAVHVIDVELLRRSVGSDEALPFHVAHKKAAHVDPAGRPVEPKSPNAIKFERFIFDLIPQAANAIVVEVDPAEGFAPLKNASGAAQDTPETVKAQMVAQHRRWLCRAGAEVAEGVDVEIGPLWAMDPDEVAAKIRPGTRIDEATYFS